LLNVSVTIQPLGAAGVSAQNSNQSTAQFAQNFVTGTLKRAIGTVTDTVTSFMTGNDTSTVVYTSGSNDDTVNVQVNVSTFVLLPHLYLVVLAFFVQFS
jgi:hypothetical protein